MCCNLSTKDFPIKDFHPVGEIRNGIRFDVGWIRKRCLVTDTFDISKVFGKTQIRKIIFIFKETERWKTVSHIKIFIRRFVPVETSSTYFFIRANIKNIC